VSAGWERHDYNGTLLVDTLAHYHLDDAILETMKKQKVITTEE